MTESTNRDALASLVKLELSAVIFVRDYVQFVLEGDEDSILTMYQLPYISHDGCWYQPKVEGYRDCLCRLIGNKVLNAKVKEREQIAIHFENGYEVYVSLCEEDYVGPEVAMLTQGKRISIW